MSIWSDRLMTLSKSGVDLNLSLTDWRNLKRSQSTSVVCELLSDSLGVSEVKKSVMTRILRTVDRFINRED